MAANDATVRPVIDTLEPRSWPPGFMPEDPTYFGGLFELLVGSNVHGIDGFHWFACSPSWLVDQWSDPVTPLAKGVFLNRSKDESAVFGAGLVLMRSWSLASLRGTIEGILAECCGPTWSVVASRINRYFPWEFDDWYNEYVDRHPEKFDWPESSTSDRN